MKKKYYYTLLMAVLAVVFFAELHAQETYSKVAINPVTQELMNELVDLGFTVDHPEWLPDGSITFYVNPSERAMLEQNNIAYRVEIEDYAQYYQQQKALDAPNLANMQRNSKVANGFDLGSMGGFYTWDEMIAKLDEMKQDYPNLITTRASIGTTIEGREIWMAKISDNPNVDEEEPVAYFDAIHHAREPLAMATTINFMFWLLENYGVDPQVTYLVNNRELYFVPIVNPDGYEYNRETDPDGGGLWRKNRNPNDGNCFGVDLNRNYAFGYATNNQCSSPDPCSGVYRGEEPFSEAESMAVRDFMALIEPKTAFSTHSTAGSYLMPYGFDTSPPAFEIYSEWASVFLSENDYPYGVTFQMLGYTSCGTTRDYMHSEGIYGWTPEIDGQGFWPPESTIFDLVGDAVGLAAHYGDEHPVVVGHDWGSLVAWQCAVFRPDLFRGVMGMSVPFMPRGPVGMLDMIEMMAGDGFHYIVHFQQPGVAEAELDADPRTALHQRMWSVSGDRPDTMVAADPSTQTRLLEGEGVPEELPGWLSEAELDHYVQAFTRSGFRGGINWYRNIGPNHLHTAPWNEAQVAIPAAFVGGLSDFVVNAGVPGQAGPGVALMEANCR
ncbi:MAG: M14 family zinc carboxypeptidase, partial [Bacteroidota bacterium]